MDRQCCRTVPRTRQLVPRLRPEQPLPRSHLGDAIPWHTFLGLHLRVRPRAIRSIAFLRAPGRSGLWDFDSRASRLALWSRLTRPTLEQMLAHFQRDCVARARLQRAIESGHKHAWNRTTIWRQSMARCAHAGGSTTRGTRSCAFRSQCRSCDPTSGTPVPDLRIRLPHSHLRKFQAARSSQRCQRERART